MRLRSFGAAIWTVALLAGAPAAANVDLPAPITQTDNRELHLKLIRDLRESGRVHAALAHLDDYDSRYPRDLQAALLRADCLVDIGAYDQAEVIYRRLLRSRNAAAAAYAGLGRAAGLRGDWAAASDHFGEAVRRSPLAVVYLSDLGYALLKSGDPEAAVFRLRQATELAPGEPKARNNLVLALEAAGQTEAAARLWAQVTEPADRRAIASARRDLARPEPATSQRLMSGKP